MQQGLVKTGGNFVVTCELESRPLFGRRHAFNHVAAELESRLIPGLSILLPFLLHTPNRSVL
jgi:hypothetical protein